MTVEEPPRYAIRLGDPYPSGSDRHLFSPLPSGACAGRSEERWFIDLEAKLRCTACGNRQGNLFEIRWSNVTRSGETES